MLALGVDALRTRLPKGPSATLVLLEPHAAVTSPRGAPSPAIHALYTKDDLLGTFEVTSGPLFVVENGQHMVKYLGLGSIAWLNPQMQAERLIESDLGQ